MRHWGVAQPARWRSKISTGEPNGKNFLQPALIKDLVQKTGGTIVECNTAYEGRRYRTEDHRQVCIDHGFAAIAPVDIMDGEGKSGFLSGHPPPEV